MEINEFSKKMINLGNQINIVFKEEQIRKFYTYMNLLIEWNNKINLTAITEPNEIIIKHFIDSLTILKYFEDKETVIDVGTGAGFPGIPIKIMKENVKVTLLDSLNKRINFLNEVIEQLELENIETIHSRIEDFGRNKKNREKFDIVTSRAVANLTTLSEYMVPLTKIGGKCICMKGVNVEEEIVKSKNAIKILGGEIVKIEKLKLPEEKSDRNIIIINKQKNTPAKYPRKAGTPSREPIQ